MNITPHKEPGDWFHVKDIFTAQELEMIQKYMPTQPISINGERGSSSSVRTFITSKSDKEIKSVFEKYLNMHSYFTDVTGIDCTKGNLRVELVSDSTGSHLDKHIDIPEKLITLQIYIGSGEPNWGTTIYHDWETQYYTVPFSNNTGWMTHMNGNIIHGVRKNNVDGVRQSVLINYVVGDWKNREQLWNG